jgi:hypothetical protein
MVSLLHCVLVQSECVGCDGHTCVSCCVVLVPVAVVLEVAFVFLFVVQDNHPY